MNKITIENDQGYRSTVTCELPDLDKAYKAIKKVFSMQYEADRTSRPLKYEGGKLLPRT